MKGFGWFAGAAAGLLTLGFFSIGLMLLLSPGEFPGFQHPVALLTVTPSVACGWASGLYVSVWHLDHKQLSGGRVTFYVYTLFLGSLLWQGLFMEGAVHHIFQMAAGHSLPREPFEAGLLPITAAFVLGLPFGPLSHYWALRWEHFQAQKNLP